MSDVNVDLEMSQSIARLAQINSDLASIDTRTQLCMLCAIIICVLLCTIFAFTIYPDYGLGAVIFMLIVFTGICIGACFIINLGFSANKEGLIAEKEILEEYLRARGYL